MMHKQQPKERGISPWGEIQTVHEIAPGIVRVTTAGHGGLWVSPERLAAMPKRLKPRSPYHSGPPWFEEDCEWARVATAFPEAFSAETQEAAARTMRAYYPEDV